METLRVRFRLLAALLLLPLAVAVGLAIGYARSSASNAQAIVAAGDLLARRLAEAVREAVLSRGFRASYTVLDPVRRLGRPDPDRAFQRMQRTIDSVRQCGCGIPREGNYLVYWVPGTGQLETRGLAPSAESLRGRLPRDWVLRDDPLTIDALEGIDSSGPWLLNLMALPARGESLALVGFDVSMSSLWNGTIRDAIRGVRQVNFPMLDGAALDSVFSVRLLAGDQEVARDGLWYTGPGSTVSLYRSNGPFLLATTLNPEMLHLVLPEATRPGRQLQGLLLLLSLGVAGVSLYQLRQVWRMMAQREAFTASISHELRTPLTQVLLHAESLLLDRPAPATNRRAATVIHQEATRLMHLIENALVLARGNRSPGESSPVPVALAVIVRQALRSLQPIAQERNTTIETSIDEDAFGRIDPVSLDRIVTNLVDNAIRHGSPGQIIRVTVATVGDESRIDVDDQGPGIPPQDRERVWKSFERGTHTPPTTEGLGLGLAIVRQLVGAAGGSASLLPGPAGGSRFRVTLPAD